MLFELALKIQLRTDGTWYGAMFLNGESYSHSPPCDSKDEARRQCRMLMDELKNKLPREMAARGFPGVEIREVELS